MKNYPQPPLPTLDEISNVYKNKYLDDQCQLISTDLISYRKIRTTWIVEYQLSCYDADGQATEVQLIGKIYSSRESGFSNYQILENLWECGWKDNPIYSMARPIAYLHEWQLLLMAKVPGKTLEECLDTSEGETAAFLVANWLTYLHRVPLPKKNADQQSRIGASMARFTKELEAVLPEKKTRLRSIFNRYLVKSARKRVYNPVFLHGDFNTKNIFLENHTVAVIDFDNHFVGDPAWDVAYLVSQIEASAFYKYQDFHFFKPIVQKLINTYLDNHPSYNRSSFYERLSLYKINIFFEILYYLFCVLKLENYEIANSFFTECENSLKDRWGV